ncbi:MAG: penicillin-binding protein 1C, partial [Gammaproteobacteria bacterium]|nr:penicillin-binding protein 1C [Gammaproteobacteria bacterium]
LKPFIYALALDQGLIHPMTLLKDAPRRFGTYTPENYDRGFLGPVFARDALALSRNVPAVHLMSRLNDPTFHGFLSAADIQELRPADHYGLALALGGHEITMEEVVKLYAMLSNHGSLKPLCLTSDTPRTLKGAPILTPEASFITLDMLRTPSPDEPAIPGQIRRELTASWKTGTSYGYRDAWTAGTFGPYVLAVWVGRFDGKGNPTFVGQQAAAPLFFEIARAVEHFTNELFTTPARPRELNIATVQVCATTGDLPDKHCPRTADSYFIPGVSPLGVTRIYREIPVDVTSGKRACYHEPPRTKMVVYEFWPSDLLALFRAAGIPRKVPPPFEADCALAIRSTTGSVPDITSPDSRIVYSLRTGQRSSERIPFSAITDADTNTLYWFVDDSFVGSAPHAEVLFWKPRVGDFEVRAVDDHGRAALAQFRVQVVH